MQIQCEVYFPPGGACKDAQIILFATSKSILKVVVKLDEFDGFSRS